MALRTLGLQFGAANGLSVYIRSSPLRFDAHRTERRQVGQGLRCSLPPGGSAGSSSPEAHISSIPEEIDEKERQRRQRISIANAGRQTWNKGLKHSPETIAKIRERTRQAMHRPEVSAKVKAARKRQPGPVLDQSVRDRISEKLKVYYAAKRAEKAAAAADGDSGSGTTGDTPPEPSAAPKRRRALSPATPQPSAAATGADATVKEQAAAAPPTPPVLPKPKRKTTAASESEKPSVAADPMGPSSPPPPPPAATRRRGPRSPEHRAAISEAIRRKWQDPEYRAAAVSAMRQAAGSDQQGPSTSGRSTSSSAGTGHGKRASMPAGSGRSGAVARRKAGGGDGLDLGDDDPLVGDLSAVRSTRTARGGGRRVAVVGEQAAGGAAAADEGGVGDTGASSSNGGGGGGSVGRLGRKARGVPGRARGSAAPDVDDDEASTAARLAHVQRLVRQVLVAQRLVATTEMLVRQVTARMDALRNDPVVRAQAEAQLASVRATLTVAKAKLDMLRGRVPPDARFNERGDVWFVSHTPTPTSGSSPPPAAAETDTPGTGPGTRRGRAAGDNGMRDAAEGSRIGEGGGFGSGGAEWEDGQEEEGGYRSGSSGADDVRVVVDVEALEPDVGGSGSDRRSSSNGRAPSDVTSNGPGADTGVGGGKLRFGASLNGSLPYTPFEEYGVEYGDLYGNLSAQGDSAEAAEEDDDVDGDDEGDGGNYLRWRPRRSDDPPPNGRPGGGGSGPTGLSSFAHLNGTTPPPPPPADSIRVDLSHLDALNVLGLAPVNGHATRGPAAQHPPSDDGPSRPDTSGHEEQGNGSEGSSGGGRTTFGVRGTSRGPNDVGPLGGFHGGAGAPTDAPPVDADASTVGQDTGAGGLDFTPADVPMPGRSSSGNGGGGGVSEVDRSVWLGGDGGVQDLGQLRAMLPASHAWLAELLDEEETREGQEGNVAAGAPGVAAVVAGVGDTGLAEALRSRPSSGSGVDGAVHGGFEGEQGWLRLLRERLTAGGSLAAGSGPRGREGATGGDEQGMAEARGAEGSGTVAAEAAGEQCDGQGVGKQRARRSAGRRTRPAEKSQPQLQQQPQEVEEGRQMVTGAESHDAQGAQGREADSGRDAGAAAPGRGSRRRGRGRNA